MCGYGGEPEERGERGQERGEPRAPASQPLLSGVNIEKKGKDELGENSVLPQIQIYCAT